MTALHCRFPILTSDHANAVDTELMPLDPHFKSPFNDIDFLSNNIYIVLLINYRK